MFDVFELNDGGNVLKLEEFNKKCLNICRLKARYSESLSKIKIKVTFRKQFT